MNEYCFSIVLDEALLLSLACSLEHLFWLVFISTLKKKLLGHKFLLVRGAVM